jgi:hypothetical protein
MMLELVLTGASMQYRASALSPPFADQRLLDGTFGTNLVSYLKSCPR